MNHRVRLQKKGQITLPSDLRRDFGEGTAFDIQRLDNGDLLLHPTRTIDIDPAQHWFWTQQWQAREREADEDLAAGRYTDLDNGDEFLANLDTD